MRAQAAVTRKAATDMITDVMATFLRVILKICPMEGTDADEDDIRRYAINCYMLQRILPQEGNIISFY